MRNPAICFSILTLLLFAGPLWGSTRTEVEERQFAFDSGGELVLKNSNGSVTVLGWDKPEFSMEAEKRVRGVSADEAKELFERIQIELEQEDGRIYIRTYYPRGGNFMSRWFGDDASMAVHYTIRVPHRTDLELSSTNGTIDVQEVEGKVDLESSNGKIRAREISGEIYAHTTNGSIDAELSQMDPQGDFEFVTTNGSIAVYVPRAAAFHLDARTTNGTVRSDFPIKYQGDHRRNRAEGRINGGGPRMVMKSTNGSLQIRQL